MAHSLLQTRQLMVAKFEHELWTLRREQTSVDWSVQGKRLARAALSALASARTRGLLRVVHDPLDSAHAATALGAATQTTMNPTRRARAAWLYGGSHIVIGQHVAGTNDHCVAQASSNGASR
jgi:hypothetical protein